MPYDIGDRATGRVVDVRPFGVFLELEDGSEGFLDASAMSEPWEPIPPADAWPVVGDVISGRSLGTRRGQTRVSVRPSCLAALTDPLA